MKCVVFYQYDKMREAVRFYEALSLEREKHPDKFPKQVTPTYGVVGDIPDLKEKLHGFYIVEAESQKQISDFWTFWHSKIEELGFKDTSGVRAIIPLIDGADIVPEWKALREQSPPRADSSS